MNHKRITEKRNENQMAVVTFNLFQLFSKILNNGNLIVFDDGYHCRVQRLI